MQARLNVPPTPPHTRRTLRQAAQVPSAHPAARQLRGGRGVFIVPIAQHDMWAAGHHLALARQPDAAGAAAAAGRAAGRGVQGVARWRRVHSQLDARGRAAHKHAACRGRWGRCRQRRAQARRQGCHRGPTAWQK